MIIQAKYIGKVNSKGFRPGILYRLNFDIVSIFGTIKERIEINNIRINNWDKDTTIQYATLKKFLNNWQVV